jgi:hypothetical protein
MKNRYFPQDGKVVGHWKLSSRCEKEKSLLNLPGIEHRILSSSARCVFNALQLRIQQTLIKT